MFHRLASILCLLLYAALGLVFIAFAILNRDTVSLTIVPGYELLLPKFLLLITTFGLGFVMAALLANLRHIAHYPRAHKERKRAEALENEIAALRAERAAHEQKPDSLPAPSLQTTITRQT